MLPAPAQQQRILVVGAGGLGFACAYALANARLTTLQVVLLDPDTIELSNLNRQLLFTPADIGRHKAERLSAALNEICPGCFTAQLDRFTPESADDALTGVDLIIDCTDSVQTKLLINDRAVARNLPFIYGGAIGEEGVALFRPGSGAACLRCLFGDFAAEDIERYGASCSRAGILGPVAGMVGIIQAQLALNWLAHGASVKPYLYRVSSESPSARAVVPQADPACPLRCAQVAMTELDLTAERCPMTFLYTKLAVEELSPRGRLSVRFADQETAESVYRSSIEAGYSINEPPSLHASGGWGLILGPGGSDE